MNDLQHHNHNSQCVGIPMPTSKCLDLKSVGQNIYNLLNMQVEAQQNWKKRRVDVELNPDYLYSPREVAAVLSVSYDTAVRVMQRMKRSANLASPRAKKRLLRVKGSDLRDYIQGTLEN